MANGRNCEERGGRSGVMGRKEFGQYCRLIFEPKSTGSREEYSLAATISSMEEKMRREEEGGGAKGVKMMNVMGGRA